MCVSEVWAFGVVHMEREEDREDSGDAHNTIVGLIE